MLDENLPTFYLRSSTDDIKHNASVLLSHQGSDALPAYSLRHPDPALPASKNRYAVALYDTYNPEILFGEVLLIPEWSQPTLSKEEIRLNGGIVPPPQPVLPTEFIIQLYNPDQQITVKWHPGTWSSTPQWGFEMPQQSFRQPSTSTLDKTQDDPTASENTPKLGFRWKKDGKLSKDYVCTLSGKSTYPDGSKRRNKEPDITVALFRHFKEITLYEPNLARIDMEDPKGLEVVLLLGAIVIREVYNSNMRETFNITETTRISAATATTSHPPTLFTPSPPNRRHHHTTSSPTPPLPTNPRPPPTSNPAPPPTDPRTQWELENEAAHLRKQQASEARAHARADAAETKRVKRMLEEEQRQAREKQKEIDRETERLKKMYDKENRASLLQMQGESQGRRRPQQQGHAHSLSQGQALTAYPPQPVQRPHSAAPGPYFASNVQPAPQLGSHVQMSGGGGPSGGGVFGGAPSAGGRPAPKAKRSFWGLRGGEGEGQRLSKQRSTVF